MIILFVDYVLPHPILDVFQGLANLNPQSLQPCETYKLNLLVLILLMTPLFLLLNLLKIELIHKQLLIFPLDDLPVLIKPQDFLKDYHCNLITNKSLSSKAIYPIDKYLTYDTLAASHQQFLLNVSTAYESSSC